ncbi:MAG TPA: PRC-barrel domain-containing protein [Geminicoccaceae bacterium]|nr:PRC-barrel domain-containing protein [Geminicoccaceae bacterium]
MDTKYLLPATLAAALTLGAAGLAGAQQATTTAPAAGVTGLHEADDDDMMVQPFNVSVDDLEDMELYGPGGEEIGEVEEVLADGSGQPVAVAAEVGGFLGVGERSVTIALDQLRLDGEHLVSGLTKEQLEALPEWEDD